MTENASRALPSVTRVGVSGEVQIEPSLFNMGAFLTTLDDKGLAEQTALAVAYDRACAALIGPNDVQQEGKRTFKKKSAWRKLGRAFNVSVISTLDDVRIEHYGDNEWCAIAHATALAPWGQRFDDIGACGSDEEEGDRTISYADAIATAMTRAANRAVSNLIAMGEVSAEEMSKRTPVRAREPLPACPRCGGAMWDNREKKERGEFQPDAPDLRCKRRGSDKQCPGEYPVWPLPEGEQRPDPTTGAAPTAAPNGTPVISTTPSPMATGAATVSAGTGADSSPTSNGGTSNGDDGPVITADSMIEWGKGPAKVVNGLTIRTLKTEQLQYFIDKPAGLPRGWLAAMQAEMDRREMGAEEAHRTPDGAS